MKTTLKLLATLVALCTSVTADVPATKFALSDAASDGVGIDAYIGYMPKENPSNLALQGETWSAASVNWMSVIRSSSIVEAGSGYARAAEQVSMDPSWMITSTAFRSWHALVDPAVQFGNRTHFGLRIHTVNPTVTFRMQDVSCRVQSYIYDSTLGWHVDGVVNITTTLAALNSFRVRLEPGVDGISGTDDDVIGVQNSGIATTTCVYGGLGVAIGAYGSGTDQEKLSNAVNYCLANNLVLRLTVTVPFTDNGNPKTIVRTMVTLPPSFNPAENLPDGLVVPPAQLDQLENATIFVFGEVGNSPLVNGLYVVEKSPDLHLWNTVTLPNLGGGDIASYRFSDRAMGVPRQFYRARRLVPESVMNNRSPRGLHAASVAPVQDSTE